ncbi:MAG TPA: hypothetical protein VIH99_03480 [Bdellovibrionota bacterium]|jgi:hypothetical protein
MNAKALTLSLSLSTILMGASAYADQRPNEIPVPRGSEIEAPAGFCRIGPFGQTNKAGPYNAYCEQLTDAEKCLALIKLHMHSHDGEVERAGSFQQDAERAAFCLDEFRNKLLGAN